MMDSSSYWINIFFGILITICNISICKSDQLGRSIDFSTSQWRPVAVAVHQPPSSVASQNLPLSAPAHLISIANFDNTDNAHLAQIAQHNAQVLRHIKGINPPITQFHNQYQTYPSSIGNGKQHLIVQTNYNNNNNNNNHNNNQNNNNNNNQNFNVHQQLNKNLPRFHYEQQPQQHHQLHRTTPNILSSSSNVAQTVLPSHYGDFKQSFISGKPAFIGKPELNPLQFLNGVHHSSSTPKIPTLFASTVHLQPNYAGGIYASTTSRAPAIRDISYTPTLFKSTSKPSQHPVVNKLQAHLALAAAHPQNSIDNISPTSIDGSNSFGHFESSLPPPPPSSSSNNFHTHQQKTFAHEPNNVVQFQNSNLLSYPINDHHSFNGNVGNYNNNNNNNNNNGHLGSAFTSYQGQLTPSGHFVSKNNFYNGVNFLPPAINSGYPQQFRTADFSTGGGGGGGGGGVGVGPLSFALQHESSFGNSQSPQQQFRQPLTSGKLSQKGATIYGPPQSISSLSAAALPTVPPSVLSPFFQQVQIQEQNLLHKQQFKEQQQQILNKQQNEQQHQQQKQQLSHQQQQQQQQPQHQQKPKKHHKQQLKVNVQILNDEFTQNLVPPPQSKHKDGTVFHDGFSPMTSTALPIVTSSTATTTTSASPSPFSSSTILPPPPSSILSHFDADYHRAVEILNKYNIPAISPLQDVNRFVYNSGPPGYQTTSSSSSSTTTAANYDNSANAQSFTTEKPNIFQNLNRPTGSSEYKQHKIMHPGYTGIKRPAHNEVSSTNQPALLPTPNTHESGGITHSFFTIEDAITLSPPPPPPPRPRVKPSQYQGDVDIQKRPHQKPKKQNQHKIKFVEDPIEQEDITDEIELHREEELIEEYTTKAIETLKIVTPPPSIPSATPASSLSPITPSTLLVKERQKIRRRRPRPTIQSVVAPTLPTNNDIDEHEQPTEPYNVQGQWETSPQTILHQENNRHNPNNHRQRNRYRFRPAAVPPPPQPQPQNEPESTIDQQQNVENYEEQEQIQEQQYHQHRQEQQSPPKNHRQNTRQRYRNQQRRPRPTISYNNEPEEVEDVAENKEQYQYTVKFQQAVTDVIPPETEIPSSSPLPLTTVSQSLNTIRYDVFDQTQSLPEENDVVIATKNANFYTTKLPQTTFSAKDSIYSLQSSPTTVVFLDDDAVTPSSPEEDEHQFDNNNISPIIDIQKTVKNTTPQVEVEFENEHINHRHRLRYREKIKESNNELTSTSTTISQPPPPPPPQLPIHSDEINDEIDENEVTENLQNSEDSISTTEKSVQLNKFGGKTRPRFSIKDYRQRNSAAGSSTTSTTTSTTTTESSPAIPTKQSKLRFPTRTRLLPGLHKKPSSISDKYNDNNNDSSTDEKELDDAPPPEQKQNNEQNVISTNRRRRPYSKDGNNNRFNNRVTSTTEIPSLLTTISSSASTTFARRFNGTRRDYRNRYSTTSTTTVTPPSIKNHNEIHRLPSIRNISSIISRRPPNLSLRQRIQQQNQLKSKLENSIAAATNDNADDLQKINDRMETELNTDTDMMEMNSNEKEIIMDQITLPPVSVLDVLDTNDAINNNADDIEGKEEIPSTQQQDTQKQETSIMKIAKDDHSYRPYMHTADTGYTITNDDTLLSTPTKSPVDDINLEYANDLNSSPSDYSERVAQLTISAANNFNTVNVGGGPSRRIPGYFTLATDDPILPIEAFFPQFKRSSD